MSYRYVLAPNELDEIFRDLILPVTLPDVHSSASPDLVVLGGQPASGKTRARHIVTNDERFEGVRFFAPEGDALRVWHPEYRRVLRDDPLLMPEVTKQASGEWLGRSVERGFDEQAPMLIEGTWRDASVPLASIATAEARGYRTHAVLVAVPPAVSRVDMLGRYYEPVARGLEARWTPPAAHDVAVSQLEATAAALAASDAVDFFSVVTRQGDFIVDRLSPSPERVEAVLAGLVKARQDFWTSTTRLEWRNRAESYFEEHLRFTSEAADAAAVWEQIMTVDLPRIEGASPHHADPPFI